MNRILLTRVFVDHVVVGKPVFVIGLGRATLYRLHLGALALDPVTHHGAAKYADHRGNRAATALSYRVAKRPAGQRTKRRARP